MGSRGAFCPSGHGTSLILPFPVSNLSQATRLSSREVITQLSFFMGITRNNTPNINCAV